MSDDARDGGPVERPVGHITVEAGDTVWRFEREFLESNWTCIWGRGCLGIGPEPAEHLGLGCCSMGAELDGLDEARTVAALAATLSPQVFQHHAVAAADGVLAEKSFVDSAFGNTRVVDGACIFLNRPGFEGGAGCALHLAAVQADESPVDWKPSVCWQLPIKVDWELLDPAGTPTPGTATPGTATPGTAIAVEMATVRGWQRRDWGDDGAAMAWCCTEGDRAYVGDVRVIDSLAEELTAIVGHEVMVELRRRIDG